MPDLPERLPLPFSERGEGGATYVTDGKEYDVAIGGVPFRLATYSELPSSIETIAVRKDQFDAELDPGEQTLSGYWRRSQASFHEGAGSRYEPNRTEEDFAGFDDSSGVEVFTPGRLTLQRVMAALGSALNLCRLNIGGTYVTAVGSVDGDLYYLNGANFTVTHAPVGEDVVDAVTTGTTYYDITFAGTLARGTVAGAAPTTWPLGGTPTRILWAKHRLWVVGNPKIWQPDLTLAAGTAQNPVFTNPNASWVYTCIAEGPRAVYFGGHDGRNSSIQSITLEASGGMPTMSGATVAATLPPGELVQEIETLAGQYIGIGTSKGFRVGVMQENGSITYGPLLISQDVDNTNTYGGVTALTVTGRFFVVGIKEIGTTARVFKVDTGTQLGDLIFPYARDAEVPTVTGWVNSVAVSDNMVHLTTTTGGTNGAAWKQSATDRVATGWLRSSRIRFHTTEPKAFKYMQASVFSLPANTSVAISVLPEIGSEVAIASITHVDQTRETYAITVGPMQYLSVTVTLNGSGASSPIFESFLARAVPAVKPQRLITLPLLCFDKEQARSGQQYGGEGVARSRLEALQALEDVAKTVTYQRFETNVGIQCLIESIKFTQQSPPTPHRHEGAGGILLLQLRTVTP